jgi:hypothetical protein
MQDAGAGNSMQTDLDGDGDVIYVWGTNLTIASVTERIRRFYTTFRTPDQRDDDVPKYVGLIRQVSEYAASWRRTCMAPGHRGQHVLQQSTASIDKSS